MIYNELHNAPCGKYCGLVPRHDCSGRVYQHFLREYLCLRDCLSALPGCRGGTNRVQRIPRAILALTPLICRPPSPFLTHAPTVPTARFPFRMTSFGFRIWFCLFFFSSFCRLEDVSRRSGDADREARPFHEPGQPILRGPLKPRQHGGNEGTSCRSAPVVRGNMRLHNAFTPLAQPIVRSSDRSPQFQPGM